MTDYPIQQFFNHGIVPIKIFNVIVFTQSNIFFSAMELLSMIWEKIQKRKPFKWQLNSRGILRTTLRKFLCSEKFKSHAIELQLTDVITPTTESFRQQLKPLQVNKNNISLLKSFIQCQYGHYLKFEFALYLCC